MKKKNIAHICTCSAILALLFGAGALSLHTNAALRGDINEDGKINANDYIALRRALLAGESLPSKTADVNGDGKINAKDYAILYNLHKEYQASLAEQPANPDVAQ